MHFKDVCDSFHRLPKDYCVFADENSTVKTTKTNKKFGNLVTFELCLVAKLHRKTVSINDLRGKSIICGKIHGAQF